MKIKNQAIQDAISSIDSARKQYENTVYNAVCECKHEEVGECEYRSSEYGSASAPERVCLHCGLMEEGWGCGYLILTNELVFKLSRDQAFSFRTVRVCRDDKGPLLRQEVALHELIRRKLGIEAVVPA
jgi:hypothetical protein